MIPNSTLSSTISKEHWRALSLEARILQLIRDDDYCKAYRSIAAQFGAWETMNWDHAVVALHIVYGWMPTIPKLRKTFGLSCDQRRALVFDLNNARQGECLDCLALERVKAFSNNSIVGGSKLLHFVRPDVYPIWDSRVANVFRGQPTVAYVLNRVDPYIAYRDTLQSWVSDPAIEARCGDLKRLSVDLADVSDTRIVELVMFHASSRKLPSDRKTALGPE